MTTSIAIYCLSKQSVVGIFPYTEEFEQRLKKERDVIPDLCVHELRNEDKIIVSR